MTDRDLPSPGRRRIRADGVLLRQLARAGSRYGPRFWLRYSPPAFGLMFAALLPAERSAVRCNLRRVRGPRGPVRDGVDVARTFCAYAYCLSESLAAGRQEAEAPHFTLSGEHRLRAVADGGQGFVVATAHVGAWDVAARLLAEQIRRPVAVVMGSEADVRARQLHDAVRNRAGVSIVHVEHPLDALPLLRHIRQGGVVAMQLDRPPVSGRSVSTALFGAPFEVSEGPFQLAAAAGCPVLPAFACRVGHFDYLVQLGLPIFIPARPDGPALRACARQAAVEMERFIREHPTQWFCFEQGKAD